MAGRPTKFNSKFCEQLIDHMTKGLSFESFAGVIGVSRRTLFYWEKENSDFSDAKEIGFSQSLLFWEKVGVEYVIEEPQGRKINTGLWAMNMKNRFPESWRDRKEELPRGAAPLSPETAAAVDEMIKEDLAKRGKSA
jgi:hypothetical protein